MTGPFLLGGLVGLDRTAFGQTLLAHPIVAATLAGWWGGDASAGARVGLVLTLVSMPAVPVGQTRLRDWSSGAVVGGFLAAGAGTDGAAGLALLLAGWTALLGAAAIAGVREAARRALGGPLPSDLARRHLGLALAHAVRGAAVVGVLVAGGDFLSGLDRPAELEAALVLLWRIAPLLGLGFLVRFTAEGVPRAWVVVGCSLALLAMWALGGHA